MLGSPGKEKNKIVITQQERVVFMTMNKANVTPSSNATASSLIREP